MLSVSRASCFHWQNILKNSAQDLFLDGFSTWLAVEHNITITPLSISRNLKEVGLSLKML
ncbi:hypothetical protein BDR07DRAFT_347713 [Suillus spraguei]|nr:hypothetical protein BDR07DRAFT_347713 [Suillus spraguei]